MIVVDASAAVLLFADPAVEPRAKSAKRILAQNPAWVVPEHWKVEVFSTVRGLWLGGKLNLEQAERALATIPHMAVTTVATNTLLTRMWELRSNISGYDAAYIATAEAGRCPLVTADARLARSRAGKCPIELVT